MATLDSNKNRKSYLLSVTPVDYSLTEGTNIPPPPESPQKQSPIEPPTLGGGPLTSHPATPPASEGGDVDDSTMHRAPTNGDRIDNFRPPTSPASAAQYSSSPQDQRNRPGGVRRLFSLTNLRSSFSSSRTSLSLPRPSQDAHSQLNGTKRPFSPSMASTTAPSSLGHTSAPPPLRTRKSANWFKRKSGMFLNGGLESVDEDQRPHTRESKRLRENSPAPLLPDISSLGGGRMSGGDLGWDEQAFKR